jgi:hypothetical protein
MIRNSILAVLDRIVSNKYINSAEKAILDKLMAPPAKPKIEETPKE